VKNSCLTDLNCGDDVCDQSTLMCVRLRTAEPYEVVLQVQVENTSVELPDAGRVSLVAQAAFELGLLEERVKDEVLEVREATRSLGRVQGMIDGGMTLLDSELTLTPRMNEAQLRKTVVNSGKSAASDDAGAEYNVEAKLDPSLTYDLRVQPLLSASSVLPPFYSAEPYAPDTRLDVAFGETEGRSARLTSLDGKSWAGRRVRLEDKATSRVLSSVAEVPDAGADAGTQGRFTLYAERKTFQERKGSLVMDLSGGRYGNEIPRWQVKMSLDAARFMEDSVLTLPSVPDLVSVEGKVTNLDTGAPLPNASLEFVSKFPVDEQSASNSNWCRQPAIPELACSARLNTTTDDQGRFTRLVVPGSYDVYVQPDRSSSPDRTTFVIDVRADDSPGMKPQSMEVKGATRYDGVVRSPLNQGMPNVTISARALGVPEEEFADPEDRELARYNRSISVVTSPGGEFSLYPDIGRYDFSVEPPSESGFAWMLCPNYQIKPRDSSDRKIPLQPFRPPNPVMLAGTVEHEGIKLPNARIEAYAVWKTEPPRLLLVARAVSDDEGRFRLAMPPELPPPVPEQGQTCPIVPKARPPEDLDAGLASMDSGLVTADGGVNAPDSAR
ncbi:MAG TPA: carboxypeptidase-like regulatory domain-containing protein, partial [Polyangiales bacterium]